MFFLSKKNMLTSTFLISHHAVCVPCSNTNANTENNTSYAFQNEYADVANP